jgi:hypothetical protein
MRGKPFPKGHPGYRRKGTPNKRTVLQRELLLKHAELSIASTAEAIRRGQQYDPRALFDAQGNLRPITELSEAEAWAIAGFDVVRRNLEGGDGHTDTVVKVRLVDRGKYVELAAKHQGMLTEKVELSGDDALIQALYAGRARALEARKSLNVLTPAYTVETTKRLGDGEPEPEVPPAPPVKLGKE